MHGFDDLSIVAVLFDQVADVDDSLVTDVGRSWWVRGSAGALDLMLSTVTSKSFVGRVPGSCSSRGAISLSDTLVYSYCTYITNILHLIST